MRHHKLTTPLAVATALVLGLGACTAGGQAGPEPASTGATGTPATSAQAASAEPPAIVDDRTPLEIWWFGHFNIWDREATLAEATEVETLVAECMAEKGWEYWPVDFVVLDAEGIPAAELDLPAVGTLAYAEEFGYGVTIDDGANAMFEKAQKEEEEWRASDPNLLYRDSLSESARAQYEIDLMGAPPPTPEQIASGEMPEADGPFCLETASEEYEETKGTGVWEDPGYLALQDEIQLMKEAIEKDQRILAAKAEWIRCMADAGHPQLVDSDAARESISMELWAYTDKGETPPPQVLTELQATERALAIADVRCQAEAAVEKTTFDVTREYERAFLAENQAEMEETFARIDTKNQEN